MLDSCPLVGCQSKSAKISYPPDGRDSQKVICLNCGTFLIVGTFNAPEAFRRDSQLMEGLRAYIRVENAAGRGPTLDTNWTDRAEEYQPSAFSKLF